MMPALKAKLLKGKGLIVGIVKDQSIALGCAKDFPALGADFPVTLSQLQSALESAMLDKAKAKAPVARLVSIDNVGVATACLAPYIMD